jgi:hypothetical protein
MSRDRKQDQIVTTLTEDLPHLLHDSDHREAAVAHDQLRAEGVVPELELFDDVQTDDAHPSPSVEVELGKEPTSFDPVIVDLLMRGSDPQQRRGVLAIAEVHTLTPKEYRVEIFDLRRPLRDRETVLVRQPDLTAREIRVVRIIPPLDPDVGGADALQLNRDHVVESLHDRHHGDHRGDPDDDPQRGQEGP